MEVSSCIDERVFWSVILWSWCGPESSEHMVLKNSRGYIQRDAAGEPIPAKAADVITLLGLGPSMKGSVSRAIQRLVKQNSLLYENRRLIPVREPKPSPEIGSESCVSATFRRYLIAGKSFHISNLELSEEQLSVAESIFESCSEQWEKDDQELKNRHLELLQTKLQTSGILISLEKQRSREKKLASKPPEPAPAEPPPPASPPPETTSPPAAVKAVAQPDHREVIRAMARRLNFASHLADSLCDEIHANLRGAPIEQLEDYTAKPDNRDRMDGVGLLKAYALDVAKLWQAEKHRKEKSEADERSKYARETEALEAIANDPQEPEDIRDKSREILRARGVELLK
jgi:hypothetical protein